MSVFERSELAASSHLDDLLSHVASLRGSRLRAVRHHLARLEERAGEVLHQGTSDRAATAGSGSTYVAFLRGELLAHDGVLLVLLLLGVREEEGDGLGDHLVELGAASGGGGGLLDELLDFVVFLCEVWFTRVIR